MGGSLQTLENLISLFELFVLRQQLKGQISQRPHQIREAFCNPPPEDKHGGINDIFK